MWQESQKSLFYPFNLAYILTFFLFGSFCPLPQLSSHWLHPAHKQGLKTKHHHPSGVLQLLEVSYIKIIVSH